MNIPKPTKQDIVQIVLNVIAACILYDSNGGKGSFWPFVSFDIIACVAAVLMLKHPSSSFWVFLTKAITYLFLSVKFSASIGEIGMRDVPYFIMIGISVFVFAFFRRYGDKHTEKLALAYWMQNLAYSIGGFLYALAVFHSPENYNLGHVLFWMIGGVSYILLIRQTLKSSDLKKRKALILLRFATVTSFFYAIWIIAIKWL